MTRFPCTSLSLLFRSISSSKLNLQDSLSNYFFGVTRHRKAQAGYQKTRISYLLSFPFAHSGITRSILGRISSALRIAPLIRPGSFISLYIFFIYMVGIFVFFTFYLVFTSAQRHSGIGFSWLAQHHRLLYGGPRNLVQLGTNRTGRGVLSLDLGSGPELCLCRSRHAGVGEHIDCTVI